MTHTRPQDLNVPLLTLALERGLVREAELHRVMALAAGYYRGNLGFQPTDVWRFSAIVNLAKQRLLRYGLMRVVEGDLLAITPLGQLFLTKGLTRLDPGTRRSLEQRTRGLDQRTRGLPESA